MVGPITVDETYIGGKAKNLHASQRDGKRGVGEYVRDEAHTNSLESFWSMLKRGCGYVGVYHRFSEQHLDRYVKGYAKCRSMRELDTFDRMTELITQFWGVRLT